MAAKDARLGVASCECVQKLNEIICADKDAIGLAVIISNEYIKVKKSYSRLAGTAPDAEKMKETFRQLRFACWNVRNQERECLLAVLQAVANHHHYPPSYLHIAIIFSGHGTSDESMVRCIVCEDEKLILIDDLIAMFQPEKASHIAKISKLFFIDACLGSTAMEHILVAKGDNNSSSPVPRGGKPLIVDHYPSHGNILIAFSTLPSFKSYETGHGSIWLNSLADKLLNYNAVITTVLTEVRKDVKRFYQDKEQTAVPHEVNTLFDSVNLFVASKKLRKEKICHS